MRSKYLLVVTIVFSSQLVKAQTGVLRPLGAVNLGEARPGNTGPIGRSSLPVCSPQNYECGGAASHTYIFTGSGNWDVRENWLNSMVPPQHLPNGYGIIIDACCNHLCILNTPQYYERGSRLTILDKKVFIIEGKKVVQ